MLDQITSLIKEHLGGNPQIASAVPPGQEDALHHEIANQITTGLASQAPAQGGIGGLLSKLQGGVASGSPITSAIEGGLLGSIASKFGLSPAITGAIAAALPGILQKFAHKANDPNDPSITPDSITKSLSGLGGLSGGLGSLFGK